MTKKPPAEASLLSPTLMQLVAVMQPHAIRVEHSNRPIDAIDLH